MSQVLKISPETTALIESYARHAGVTVEEYLRGLLPGTAEDMGLRGNGSVVDFENDMASLMADTEASAPYPGTYSREDIYEDHN